MPVDGPVAAPSFSSASTTLCSSTYSLSPSSCSKPSSILMPNTKNPTKNALDIRLTENVVFLRAGDATGRIRHLGTGSTPGVLRGLLMLTLVKPTKIASIEIELVGKTATSWPEGVGARRVEVTEDHTVYSQSYVFFRAGAGAGGPSTHRRPQSVGPGLTLDREDDDRSEELSEAYGAAQPGAPDPPRGRARNPRPPPSPNGEVAPPRRPQSVDQVNLQRGFVAHQDRAAAALVSPPYSPMLSPLRPPPPPTTHSPMLSPIRVPSQHTLSPSASFTHTISTLDESVEPLGDELLPPPFQRLDSSPMRSPVGSGQLSWLPPDSAAPSVHTPEEIEPPEFLVGSSRSPATFRGGSRTTRTPSRSKDRVPHDERGRKHKHHFSLTSVSNALLEAVKDTVRSHAHAERESTPPRGRTRDRTATVREQPVESTATSRDVTPPRDFSTLGRLPEVRPAEDEEDELEKEGRAGWKEFRKGVYTYPVSFTIPVTAPPTLFCDFGSVVWRLKAYAHRPGTFTSKLSAMQEIMVVTCPDENETEDTEAIIVERQWDTQMQYLLTISGRAFAIGGHIPISITFAPWSKMKIHRISVVIEQKVDYWTQFKRVARSEPVTRHSLFMMKPPGKDGILLPLSMDDPNAFSRSPFAELVPPTTDAGEYASSLMGPGPWIVQKAVPIPESIYGLNFTNKNKRSNISVTHTLKVIFRVERGDDEAVDAHGKRKMFDIVVQTPVHILSRLCVQENTALPPYSAHTHDGLVAPPSSASTYVHDLSQDSPVMGLRNGDAYLSPTRPGLPDRVPSQQSLSSGQQSPAHANGSPGRSRQNSVYDRTYRFERLITGQESEIGEAPPSYNAVV